MVATSAPLSETQTGVLGPRDMPQALTRFGSVKVATPGWSETRFSCRNVPVPAAPAGTANAPANASDSAAAMKPRFMTMTRLLDVGWPAPAIVSPATRAHQPPAGTPSDGTSTGGASSSTHSGHGTVARRPASAAAAPSRRSGSPGGRFETPFPYRGQEPNPGSRLPVQIPRRTAFEEGAALTGRIRGRPTATAARRSIAINLRVAVRRRYLRRTAGMRPSPG